jgi:arylsulfatase A-like enzyme
LTDNTLLVFTSDNGGESNVTVNGPLRGGKSMLYEGGIREPLIVRWPARINGGRVCDVPVSVVDFFPTFAQIAGAAMPDSQPFDGVSMLPLMMDDAPPRRARPLVWHYPLAKPHFLGGRSAGAILDGDWKLIEFYDAASIELYNLSDDPAEKTDLSALKPDITARLHGELKSIRAAFPPPSAPSAEPAQSPKRKSKVKS